MWPGIAKLCQCWLTAKRILEVDLMVFPFDTLRPRQNGCHFPDIFKRIFLNKKISISIKISLKFVPKGPINNIPALVKIMAWHHPGDKPLSEPMMFSLLTHICVTRPRWVNSISGDEWCIYVSIDMIDWTIIGSDNGLLPVWFQAIILTNASLLSGRP